MNRLRTTLLCFLFLITGSVLATAQPEDGADKPSLSLITVNADEGFALAVTLARRGVTTTQPNREVLFEGRAKYSVDPDSLIAASQVIAIHFQTIAAANNYWSE